MYRIYMALGRKGWSDRVNVLIKFEFHEMKEIFSLPAGLLDCQDGFCFMAFATCLKLTGPTSSYIRLCCTLYQVQSQAQIHTAFYRVLNRLSLIPSYLVADIIIED